MKRSAFFVLLFCLAAAVASAQFDMSSGGMVASPATIAPPTPVIQANMLYRLKAGYGETVSSGRIDSILPYQGSVTDAATQASSANRPYSSTDNQGNPVILLPNPTNCWLDLPGSLSVDARDFTAYIVHRSWRGEDAIYLDSSTYTGSYLGATSVSTTGSYANASTRSSTSVKNYLNQDVLVVASSSGAVKFYNSQQSGSGAGAMGAGTNTNLRMGEFTKDEIYDLIIYSGTHTDQNVSDNINALATLYPGIRTTPWTKQLIATGDSVTMGNAPGGNDAAWPSRLIWDHMPDWRAANKASSGSTVASETTKEPSVNWYADAGLDHDVLVILIGRNDMGSSGGFQSPETVYANLVTLVQSYKANVPHRDVWVGTLPRTADSGNDPEDDTYNNLIRTGIVTDAGATGVVDFQTGVMATYNPIYYYDSVHPNNAGAAALASIAYTTLNAYYNP